MDVDYKFIWLVINLENSITWYSKLEKANLMSGFFRCKFRHDNYYLAYFDENVSVMAKSR